ncbi:maltooligosyl trehalose hydrolase [Faunimonas pinastri]|uniref:Malto-oligosyltrehalose trehalohydrolase n=1 Tax=Faunimonas pinastri TaxID=1855383 RepID=A0A1H9LX35_9HYPH|nr:malto-oligosyltrehalose trehalohydrolase [Faunimonas pinastri]SER15767.1 maltooligosyl trehalose hydrolase [Faunimonas pinastri]
MSRAGRLARQAGVMGKTFQFEKQWGSELIGGSGSGSGARFRIWSPTSETMQVRSEESGRDVPMTKTDGGWFELETDEVPVGGGYRFVLPDGFCIPDPAARAQTGNVHSPSRLWDPKAYEWKTGDWKGRPWEETVFYELHTGTFTPEGTFDAICRKLDHLADTGVTCLELLPIAQYGGTRGWGYDGVMLYTPHVDYGTPDDLKKLIDAAHERGLMMFLDVVYNHFGPEGSYLHLFAPDFFHFERKTPWGAAIAYEKDPVRRFFIENALYWLEEFRFDGLRFDAIDQIDDQSEEPLLEEFAREIRARITDRHVHLTTEDARNITTLHERGPKGQIAKFSGEWNDDVHHCFHTIATGESEVYYRDYSDDPMRQLARALATGFVYQGETSPSTGKERGFGSAHLPPATFVDFLQNHDQIGNRAFGERLTALSEPQTMEIMTAALLLSPHIPLLYMGEEYGETNPFYFFTDFHGDLGEAVRQGRREEFRHWTGFSNDPHQRQVPDPNAIETFQASKLDWTKLDQPYHRERLNLVKRLLSIRAAEIAPRMSGIAGHAGHYDMLGDKGFVVHWQVGKRGRFAMYFNAGEDNAAVLVAPEGRVLFESTPGAAEHLIAGSLPAQSLVFLFDENAEPSRNTA